MAATIKINFAIGGIESVGRVAKSITQAMTAEARAQTRVAQQAAQEQARIAKSAAQDQVRLARAGAKEKLNAQRGAAREAAAFDREMNRASAANFRQRVRLQDQERRKTDRAAAVEQRQQERASSQARGRVLGYVGAAGKGALEGVRVVAGGAMRIAGGIMGGMGIDGSVQHAVSTKMEREKIATDISNSGLMESGTRNRTKVDPKDIMAQAAKVGAATATDPTKVLEGLSAFVGKTGELDTGLATMEMMAKVAKATGSNFDDVANAAGAISNKLGDVPDKGAAIQKVLLAMAGQGKVGAVEIKDLASQMEKLTSQATKFKPNAQMRKMMGSDAGANIATLGVLAQSARRTEKGTAAQATQSAMAFVRDLSSQTSIKRLGGKQFTDASHTQLKDPQEIIKDIISETKGDVGKLSYLMPNQNSRAVPNSFMDPYKKAYDSTRGTEKEKDTAGRAAIDAAFNELKNATMSDVTMQKQLAAALDTTASKAELFQQKLDTVIGGMADKVMPALIKMAPLAEKAATALGAVAEFAGKNPEAAAGLTIGAYVLKAMASQAVSNMMVTAANVVVAGKGMPSPTGLLPPGAGAGASGGAGVLGSIAVAGAAFVTAAATIGAAAYAMNAGVERFNKWEVDSGRRFKEHDGDPLIPRDKKTGKKLNLMPDADKLDGPMFSFLRANAPPGAPGAPGAPPGTSPGAPGAVPSLGAPGVAGGKGDGGAGGQALVDISAALGKPMQLAPGATITIANVGEIASAVGAKSGRDTASQPITGK